MGRAKDQLAKEQERGSHLDSCMKCGAILRTWQEREIAICESCFNHSIEKD